MGSEAVIQAFSSSFDHDKQKVSAARIARVGQAIFMISWGEGSSSMINTHHASPFNNMADMMIQPSMDANVTALGLKI
jgi:hypothetical protein